MFDIGAQELVIIFIVALLVIGPQKLPEFGRTAGKWVVEIRRGINIAKDRMKDEFGEQNEMSGDIIKVIAKKEPDGGSSGPGDEKVKS